MSGVSCTMGNHVLSRTACDFRRDFGNIEKACPAYRDWGRPWGHMMNYYKLKRADWSIKNQGQILKHLYHPLLDTDTMIKLHGIALDSKLPLK